MDFGWMSAGAVAVFAWLAVESWLDARRKERDAFYRNETVRRIAESAGGPDAAIGYLREEERIATWKSREKLKLAGLICTAGGAGFAFFMFMMDLAVPAWSLGTIPVLVGIAILIYVYVLARMQ